MSAPTTGLIGDVKTWFLLNIVKIARSSDACMAAGSEQIRKSFRSVPTPIDQFQGREELLKAIHDALTNGAASTESGSWKSCSVALVGFGGMGKSELARKFAQVYKAKYPNVAWINAETEQEIRLSFTKLAGTLNLQMDRPEEGWEIAERVFRHINEHVDSTSLFIYDNANRLKTSGDEFGIFDYLPLESYAKTPLILITSRTKEWGRENIKMVELHELNKLESENFFVSRFGLADNERLRNKGKQVKLVIHKVLDLIQGYPLALQVCAASITYIPTVGSEELLCCELENLAKTVASQLLSQVMHKTLDTATDYDRTFDKVWTETMDQVKKLSHEPDPVSVLQVLAYCDPDYPKVPDVMRTFHALAAATQDGGSETQRFHTAMQLLNQLMLIRRHHERQHALSWTIHRMIQAFARLQDEEGVGLRNIVQAKSATLLVSYVSSPAEINLRALLQFLPAVFGDSPLIVACKSDGAAFRKCIQFRMESIPMLCLPVALVRRASAEDQYLERVLRDNDFRDSSKSFEHLGSNSLELYMSYVMCCELALRDQQVENQCSFVRKLDKWLPQSVWKTGTRLYCPEDVTILKHKLLNMDWNVETDSCILRSVAEKIRGAHGRYNTGMYLKVIDELQSYNFSLFEKLVDMQSD